MKLRILFFIIALFILNPIFSQKRQFEKGYYLDSLNIKVEGYIKIINGSIIKFRNKPQGKNLTLKSDIINGFNINGINYRIINNFKAKSDNVLTYTKYNSGFAKEVILGDINLFSYIITTNNGMYYGKEEYYFTQKDKENTPIQVFSGRKKFRKQIRELTNDKTLINEIIDFKKVKYQDIESIIEKYNGL